MNNLTLKYIHNIIFTYTKKYKYTKKKKSLNKQECETDNCQDIIWYQKLAGIRQKNNNKQTKKQENGLITVLDKNLFQFHDNFRTQFITSFFVKFSNLYY